MFKESDPQINGEVYHSGIDTLIEIIENYTELQ